MGRWGCGVLDQAREAMEGEKVARGFMEGMIVFVGVVGGVARIGQVGCGLTYISTFES